VIDFYRNSVSLMKVSAQVVAIPGTEMACVEAFAGADELLLGRKYHCALRA